jgi:hypothetical protein
MALTYAFCHGVTVAVLGQRSGISRVGPGISWHAGRRRTLPGMARVRSGQAPAWPLLSDRSVRKGSGSSVTRVCVHQAFSPVLVVVRAQSRLRLEGRTRTLSGPSPDLSPAGTLDLPLRIDRASSPSLRPDGKSPGQATRAERQAAVLVFRTRSERQCSAERDHVHLVQRWLRGGAAAVGLRSSSPCGLTVPVKVPLAWANSPIPPAPPA